MKQQIAIYLRLSLEDVDKRTNQIKDVSNSIVSQRLLINRHLDETPFLCNLPRLEFCDDGFSGTNFDRPEFTRMIDLARKGEISCIVVKDLSRFGRDYLEVGDYLEHIFPFLGIRFKSINDYYDSEKHKGKTIGMDIAFKNLIYDYYSKDLSKKVKSAMDMKQRECSFVNTVPYGYTTSPDNKHMLVIDPATAPIVRRIFMDIIAGKSCTAIAKSFNTEGIPTPAQQKNIHKKTSTSKPQWTHAAIHNLINNIKYTGTMVNHTRESRFIRDKNQRRVPEEEWYIKENAHQAIVTQDEYNAAMSAIQRRRKCTRLSHDQSDRVYFCGHCGGKLEKANDTVFACRYHRYHDGSPCENVHWRKAALEEVVLEALKQQIQVSRVETRELRDTISKKNEDLAFQMTMLRAQYDALEREKFTIYEKYRESEMTAEEYLVTKDEMTTKQKALKEQIDDCEIQLEENHQKSLAATERQEAVGRMSSLSEAQLREHLYDAVEKILVFDTKSIEIIWKFNDLYENTDYNVGVG
ncbi:MAG: recombinase family protein [Clostridiales bacterium]|jgi:site-specific DNA recombinase|nr:recombinase family protein [Clostridiales bacterium]